MYEISIVNRKEYEDKKREDYPIHFKVKDFEEVDMSEYIKGSDPMILLVQSDTRYVAVEFKGGENTDRLMKLCRHSLENHYVS